MKRVDGRDPGALRPVLIEKNPLRHPPGSALVSMGGTKVLCAATMAENVPHHCFGTGRGWLTAEYAMLPCSSGQRIPRDGIKGKIGGRSHEIQRLIGRALRSVFRLDKLGERTITIDCDVIEADGGTRVASITGAFVALALAARKLREERRIGAGLITDYLAAVSVGIVEGTPVLDLNYIEDSQAEVDMNVVRTGSGRYVEIQGTSEGAPFDRAQLDALLVLADSGIDQIIAAQRSALGVESFPETS